MDLDIFRYYLKTNLLVLIATVIISLLCNSFKIDNSFIYFLLPLNVINIVLGYFKYKERMLQLAELERKGLTEEDLFNIAFVKKWEETRKQGVIKFSLIYGGIYCGLALCFAISCLLLVTTKKALRYVMDEPAHMFGLIGYSYLAGMLISAICYRLRWWYNEQKFIRLTDPLH